MIRRREGARPSFGSSLALTGWTRAILWFTRFRHESPSWSTHLLNMRRDLVHCVESTGGKTQERAFAKHYDDGKHWGVLVEIVGFTDEQWDALDAKGDEYLDEVYGFFAIARHAVDGLLGKIVGRDVFFFRRMAKGNSLRYNICSWFTTYTHRAAGWLFQGPDGKPLNPGRATPDDVLDDVFERRPGLYIIAAEFGPRPDSLPASYALKIDRDIEGRGPLHG